MWTLLVVGGLLAVIGVIFAALIQAAGAVLGVEDPIEHPTRLEAMRALTARRDAPRSPWRLAGSNQPSMEVADDRPQRR